ncbi:MAG TPA: hypothetical protein VIC06_12845 [Solirubrobacteraceae bacterium]
MTCLGVAKGKLDIPVHGLALGVLFEEIKVMFQDLPSRIDVVAERVREPPGMRKVHPGMIHEMILMLSRGEPNPGTAALITGLGRKHRPQGIDDVALASSRVRAG